MKDYNLYDDRSQMLRYWQEALLFRPGTTRVFVIIPIPSAPAAVPTHKLL